MAVFAYEALDSKGRKRKGVIEADSPRQARQKLRSEDLNAVSINAMSGKEAAGEAAKANQGSKPGFQLFQKQANAAEVTLMTRQLATLVAAGIPLEECLHALVKQLKKPHLKSIMTTVRSKILEGETLADSMGYYSKTFDHLYRAMVASGEKSGHLSKVLERLADYTESQQKVKSQLIQAMIYPIMLTIVAVGVVGALLTTVVPTVVEQFSDMGQKLPQSTQILITLSDFAQEYGLALVVLIIGLFVLRQQLLSRNPKLKMANDRFMLKVPVVGGVIAGVDTARFARTLNILTSSAVPLLEGMGIASQVLVNNHIQKSLGKSAEQVREGSSLWQALEQTELFSPMMLYIIASGEKSGELTSMLARAADTQEKQLEDQINIALGVFSPLLIVMMAGAVLFIVVAILTPMLNLNNMVSM